MAAQIIAFRGKTKSTLGSPLIEEIRQLLDHAFEGTVQAARQREADKALRLLEEINRKLDRLIA